MKVLLVHTPALFREKNGKINTSDIRIMPVGLVAIANALRKNGIRAEVLHLGIELDADADFCIEKYVKAKRFDVVGISIHWHKQIVAALDIAGKIKRMNRNVFVLSGGFTASFFAGEIMRKFEWMDGVIRGDGEVPMLALANELGTKEPRLDRVPNLFWRRNGSVVVNEATYVAGVDDVNALDFGDMTVLKHYRRYRDMTTSTGQARSLFYLVNGRGCPHKCTYCGGGREAQKLICSRKDVIRQHPEALLGTIEKAHSLGWNTFYLSFDPLQDTRYYSRLFRRIREKGLHLSMVFGSWGLPSKKLIDELAETFPSLWVELSPESFALRPRKLNKGPCYSNRDLVRTIAYLAEKGIGVSLFFGYFLPFERFEEILFSLSSVLELREKYREHVAVYYIPYSTDPGSPLYLDPLKYGMDVRARNLEGYIRAIRRAARLRSTENMILSNPVYFSAARVRHIHQLIQVVWYLDTRYPITAMLMKGAYGGYLRLLGEAFRRLEEKDFRANSVTVGAVRSLLRALAANQEGLPVPVKTAMAYEDGV